MNDEAIDKAKHSEAPTIAKTDAVTQDRSAGFGGWMRSLFGNSNSEVTWRESLDEMIEDRGDADVPINESEHTLIKNILEIRDSNVSNVMVPRVDIVATSSAASFEEIIEIMTSKGHSRIPVYGETLDDVVGMVHIKDVVAWRGQVEKFSLGEIQRTILFVSPSMPVLELLLEMRVTRTHMAIVVDEYGGVDGLLTIEDLVEEIVGDIEDEHDGAEEPDFLTRTDGTFEADARVEIEILEEAFGPLLIPWAGWSHQ